MSQWKQLTYIVNYLSVDDAQHYVHIPGLLAHLERLGWDVDLVSERGGQGRSDALGRRVTYLSRAARWGRIIPLVRHLLEMHRGGGRLVFVRISRSAAFVSAILGRILGWKTVYWLSGTVEDFNLRSGVRGCVEMAVVWLLLRLVDRLATGPESMVDYYRKTYGLSPLKILLLYNDVDLDDIVLTRSGGSQQTRVLLVHRLSPVRETDRYFPALLEALDTHARLAHVPVALDICGDGPERAELERIAKAASDRVDVHFHGAVPQRQLGEYYARADMFVAPSYREGFPRVLLEAMARGLPIVATDAGGTRDILGPEQLAYVVDRDRPEDFGDAVKRLLSSVEDRRRLGGENLRTVQRFSTPQVARMYDRVLSELVGARPAS